MGKKRNWVGIIQGKLTVISEAGKDQHGNYLWCCKCTCGATAVKSNNALSNGISSCSTTCGVADSNKRRSRHGMWQSREHHTWRQMKDRCFNPNNARYARYGGRGITICDAWLIFENFYADMGNKPEGMTLDRIDNNGNYEPENCRWATIQEQQNNIRSNRMLTYEGKTQTMAQWARELGVAYHVLKHRLNKGWRPPKLFSQENFRGKF